MNILALETSTEYCSVALWQDGAISSRCEAVGQKHSERLMPMIDSLLREAGVTMKQLDGIAFGMGPGSFTGVRIACGVAQGLALGANLPVIGVCTLEALAEASGHGKVVAVLDARMGEIYHAAYEKQGGSWIAASEPCLCKPADAPKVGNPLSAKANAELTPPVVTGEGWFAAGSGFSVNSEALQARYAGQLCGVDGTVVPQASAIAALGARRLLRGDGMDAALALPLYLRDKVALKTSEREAR